MQTKAYPKFSKLFKKTPFLIGRYQRPEGFTLIELLVVIAILTALATVVSVALNPAQRLADSRNARRTTDVDTILAAIHTAIVDNKGTLPAGLSTNMSDTQLGTGSGAQCSPVTTGTCSVAAGTACVNLATPLVKYLKSIPIDPNGTATSVSTGYAVNVDANNIVTVKACNAEGTTVTASR